MAKRKKGGEAPEGSERWLITYADMITLLMVMFVVFFAMATVDLQKFKAAAQSLREGFGASRPESRKSTAAKAVPIFEEAGETPLEGLGGESGVTPIDIFEFGMMGNDIVERIEEYFKEAGIEIGKVSVDFDQRGIVITISPDNILFDSGQATLKHEFREILNILGPLLLTVPNQVIVEGHTDSVPISTAKFPSNWELSGARAGAVVRYFIRTIGIPDDRLGLAGYGEIRPVAKNSTPEGRSRNRRVEIIIVRSSHSASLKVPRLGAHPRDGSTLSSEA